MSSRLRSHFRTAGTVLFVRIQRLLQAVDWVICLIGGFLFFIAGAQWGLAPLCPFCIFYFLYLESKDIFAIFANGKGYRYLLDLVK